jgi:hypothetical protein
MSQRLSVFLLFLLRGHCHGPEARKVVVAVVVVVAVAIVAVEVVVVVAHW